MIVVALVVLGLATKAPMLRKWRKLPRDPGFPREPQGAPYRGPH